MTTQMVHLRDCASRPKFVYFFEALTAKGLSEPSIQRWFVQGRVRPPPSDPRGGGLGFPQNRKRNLLRRLTPQKIFFGVCLWPIFQNSVRERNFPPFKPALRQIFFVQGEGGPTLSPLYLITCWQRGLLTQEKGGDTASPKSRCCANISYLKRGKLPQKNHPNEAEKERKMLQFVRFFLEKKQESPLFWLYIMLL